jgi:hypothetical protein
MKKNDDVSPTAMCSYLEKHIKHLRKKHFLSAAKKEEILLLDMYHTLEKKRS